jgi:Uri superfamily endonuclease
MRGIYVLVIEVTRPAETEVGKLGRVRFPPGTYAYVGSAMRGIEARVARHLWKGKRLRWHIDYLLSCPGIRVADIFVLETPERVECRVAGALAAGCEGIPGFGSSDCRCRSHLFRCELHWLIGTLHAHGLRALAESDLRRGHGGQLRPG